MADIIRNQASLCLECRDALTNLIIEAERLRVHVSRSDMEDASGQQIVIGSVAKEHRFLLLYGIGQGNYIITVEVAGYEIKSCNVSMGENELEIESRLEMVSGDYVYMVFGMPMLALRLYPGTQYGLPDGYVRKSVQANPFTLVREVIDTSQSFMLMEDYNGGRVLKMHAGGKIVGGLCRIQNKVRKGDNTTTIGQRDFAVIEEEDFVAMGETGEKGILLNKELTGSYPIGSRVYLLYEAVADEEGNAVVICREE